MPNAGTDARSVPDEVLEVVRWRAIRARELGSAVADRATILGVSRATVSRWCSAYQQGGKESRPGDRTGRLIGSGRTLTPEQEEHIRQAIGAHDPESFGIAWALWTRQAVAELITKEFALAMPIRTVGEDLNRWGFTPRKPTRKSYQQDPQDVRRWLDEEDREIERRAAEDKGEIPWGDETGVRSTCPVDRGYAPRGETPELKVAGSRFSVPMMSTITHQGKGRGMIDPGRRTAAVFIVFLSRLLRRAERTIVRIVENLSVPEAAAVEAWLQAKKDRLEIFHRPRYSPELNPDESLNWDVKNGGNRHGLPQDRGRTERPSENLHAQTGEPAGSGRF